MYTPCRLLMNAINKMPCILKIHVMDSDNGKSKEPNPTDVSANTSADCQMTVD